ncbi:MAG: hypothetical protein WCR55_14065 [Lentisphaerota bacterium]
MKYEQPIIFSLKSPIETLCGNGSTASGNYGFCSTGLTHNHLPCSPGGAPQGNCTGGTEAGRGGGSCLGGTSPALFCDPGAVVGASVCQDGGIAGLCSSGTTG